MGTNTFPFYFGSCDPCSGVNAADKIEFVRDVKPILESACVRCHGPEKPKARARWRVGGEKGGGVVPGSLRKGSTI
jgi:hypothetical protein